MAVELVFTSITIPTAYTMPVTTQASNSSSLQLTSTSRQDLPASCLPYAECAHDVTRGGVLPILRELQGLLRRTRLCAMPGIYSPASTVFTSQSTRNSRQSFEGLCWPDSEVGGIASASRRSGLDDRALQVQIHRTTRHMGGLVASFATNRALSIRRLVL